MPDALCPAARLSERFKTLIEATHYPCVGAKSALAHNQLRLIEAENIQSPQDDAAIHAALRDFAQQYQAQPDLFQSLAVLFRQPRNLDEPQFEQALWARVQSLEALDARAGHAYDPRVSPDANSPYFSLSFGGEAFFLIGLHPGASRPARRFETPALVFNPHDQFEQLRHMGLYDGLSEQITKRDTALSGSPNPMLSRHGDTSEARQYSGRAVGKDWTCPYSSAHKVKGHQP